MLLAYLVWYGIVPKFRSLGADGAVITLEARVDDPHELGADSSINRRLTGSLVVPELLQDAAMCRNGTDWLSDITVNNYVVVSTSAVLIRAAELAESGRFEGGFVREVEQRLWNGVDPSLLHRLLADDGWDKTLVDEYLAERSRPPSTTARGRFVAYAAAVNNFGHGLVRVIDVGELDRAAIRAFADAAGSPRIFVAGSTTGPRSSAPAVCDDVLDALAKR